ncbi:MAG: hypothetical protein MK108_09660 [Mariniblastus sp.]|nr:hypothetical protein [Mariniblastus sp.]
MNWNSEMERSRDELDWQAFRYVADEMNPSQRREFEDRMADDQELRDAVVRVMELGELTYHCLQSSSSSNPVARPANRSPERAMVDRSVDRLTPDVGARPKKFRAPGILFAAAVGLFFLASTWVVIWQGASEHDSVTVMNLDVVDAWSNLGAWEPGETWTLPTADPGFSERDPWLSPIVDRDSDVETEVEAMGHPSESDTLNSAGGESGNWMLVALIDLEREEAGGSK